MFAQMLHEIVESLGFLLKLSACFAPETKQHSQQFFGLQFAFCSLAMVSVTPALRPRLLSVFCACRSSLLSDSFPPLSSAVKGLFGSDWFGELGSGLLVLREVEATEALPPSSSSGQLSGTSTRSGEA